MHLTAKQGDAILKQALGLAPPGTEQAASSITRSRAFIARVFLILTAGFAGVVFGIAIGQNVEKAESRTRSTQLDLPDWEEMSAKRSWIPTLLKPKSKSKKPNKVVLQKKLKPRTYDDCNRDRDCCNRLGGSEWRSHILAQADMHSGYRYQRIAVYPRGDVLSGDVRKLRVWDNAKTKHMLIQLRKIGRSAVLLDVGANIGWFSLAAAYDGHRVIAIEPHRANLELFRHSLCLAPPEVRERITILNYGLGAKDGGKCELWQQPSVNRGNAITICSPKTRASMIQDMRESNYEKSSVVHIKSLDSLIRKGRLKMLKGDKVVLKLHIEGYEPYAWEGMRTFIRKMKPSVIYTEFCRYSIMRAAQSMNLSEKKAQAMPEKYLKYLKDAGYKFKIPEGGPGVVHAMTLFRN